MQPKGKGDLNLHFSASNSSTNSQNQQENRLWKMRFWAYFRWSIFFFTHYVRRRKKTIEKKWRKHAKLCSKKIEEILTSIAVPLTAQPTLRINKKIDLKMRFLSIFSMFHLFFKTHYVREKKRSRKIEKTCQTMRQKDRGDLKLHFSAINSSTNSESTRNRLWKMRF